MITHTDKRVAVIIPTYDNERQLKMAVNSIRFSCPDEVNVVIVNNHPTKEVGLFGLNGRHNGRIRILNPKMNLGWEGGLALGLSVTDEPIVVFSNDDIVVPLGQFIDGLLALFDVPDVGAVGPASNCVMGHQSIFAPTGENHNFEVPFLIGFFVAVRRSALNACGGIDTKLPGGDDIDLSIRLRRSGYKLICRKDIFVFHHGFQTGVRIHGDHTKPFGWNSPEMTERTWKALHAKHGDAAIEELKLPLEDFWKLSEKEPVWR